MSTTLRIGVTTWSVQSTKPNQAYGQLAQIPMKQTGPVQQMLFRVALSKIPLRATVVSAVLELNHHAAQSGTFSIRAYPHTSAWPGQVTYAKRPTVGPQAGTASVTNPKARQLYRLNVTGAVQQVVSGQRVDRGWRLEATTGTAFKIRGVKAAAGKPVLVVTYTVPPPTPTGLEPSDAGISTDKPVLIFDADNAINALQVQIDPAGNGLSPAFDSARVIATGGMYDLAETGYPGLAEGAVTYWRVRQQTDGGWSGWSSWVSFTRLARPSLTITSPSGTPDAAGNLPVADGTPPVTWTLDAEQVAWRVRLLAENGTVIADSRRCAGDDADWTPAKGLARDGQVGLIQVEAWDASERTATPGDPQQSIATLAVVLATDATIEAFTALTAAGSTTEPVVTVTGRRSAIPDQIAVTRDGLEVARTPGGEACRPAPGGGYLCTALDVSATMNRRQRWSLVPVVNNNRGPGGEGIELIPRTPGIWLTSVENPEERVVILGDEDQDQDQPETAVVHQPLGDDLVQQVVRRRLVRSAPAGSISGQLADVPSYGWDANRMEETLRGWVERDAGDLYTLVLGGYTGRVIIGEVTFAEVDSHPSEGRRIAVRLSWWSQDG